MNQKQLIIGGIVLAAIVALYFLYNSMAVPKGNCLKVLPGTTPWQGDMKADWGAYGDAKRRYLNVEPETLESEYVDGWFKAADIQPHSKYIRRHTASIKAWLASGRADKHWNVGKGELRCSN